MRNKHGHLIAFPFYGPDGAGSGAGGGGGAPAGDAGGAGPAGGDPAEGDPPAPPSFDELLKGNKDYQAAHDRKVSQALATAKKKWEQQQREDLTEAEKLANMNDAQRQAYQLNKERAALDAERAEFARKQLQVSVGTELQKRGLSAEFAPYLTGADSEASQVAIERFESLWNAALESAINGRMRSDPPRDSNPETDYSQMSDAEYYAAVMKQKE